MLTNINCLTHLAYCRQKLGFIGKDVIIRFEETTFRFFNNI